ncbi:DUF5682 family protein [Paenibacillus soyae]|uniref:DUF5682 family protein n=1 Tax=Paenibacillus soyae TaxID=2969249 RepID=A0A9X2S9G7_9BACL|nr:DUF5682 family protein [Paenibacillus soyae]MCR2802732.1 DUF5682 family protein [Paenibacillus soyae]
MEKLVPRMLGDEPVTGGRPFHVFGIRHLSPAGAHHLLAFLDDINPTAVLIEGPADACGLIGQLTARGVVPPIAILAYTDHLPVRTLLYPYAEYSPEYQAFVWAASNGAEARFIDLPTEVSLALYDRRRGVPIMKRPDGGPEDPDSRGAFRAEQSRLFEDVVKLAGESDFESFWERQFEHNGRKDAYRKAVARYSELMRSRTEAMEWEHSPEEAAYNEVRESYMRRRIQDAIDAGHEPDRIVVVTGAHHTSAMDLRLPPIGDKEISSLPKVSTKLTLMPYSYYKLSTRSGYGAGNQAPAYYELLWDCMKRGDAAKLPAYYLSRIAEHLRAQGTFRSTASVIEGVRLAEALAALHDGSQPTWRDLQDAAVVCLGFGERSVIAEALARTDIGTAIGSLPEGVSQTPVQDDLNRELKRLKLTKYKTAVAETLELDLRENRRVQSEEAAFLDLNRSVLLHRLELLGIGFAKRQRAGQQSATWAERWDLQWTPESEIQTVESTLKGETVELAAAFALGEKLEGCADLAEASRLIRIACDCSLHKLMEDARSVLQQLAVDAGNFEQIAAAVHELSVLAQYGSIRRLDTAPLLPLLQQLFLRGSLLLLDASGCNDDAAAAMASAIQIMQGTASEHYDTVDAGLWRAKLEELAFRDDRNAKLSGLAFAILLEKNEISEEQCSREVARRLSLGIPADLGAGWFEGLAQRNRYALLSRSFLWKQLDDYIATLTPEAFQRSLVFLRRAFGAFEPREKAAVAEMMGGFWGVSAEDAAIALQEPLSEEEKEKLDELNEFDFGDL